MCLKVSSSSFDPSDSRLVFFIQVYKSIFDETRSARCSVAVPVWDALGSLLPLSSKEYWVSLEDKKVSKKGFIFKRVKKRDYVGRSEQLIFIEIP